MSHLTKGRPESDAREPGSPKRNARQDRARNLPPRFNSRRPPPLAPKNDHSRVTHLCPDHAKARLRSSWRMCGMDPRPPRRYRQGADYRLCANQSWRTETLFRCGSHRLQTGYAGGSSLNHPNISPGTPDRGRLRYPICSADPGRLRAARCTGAGLHADVRWHGSLGKLLTLRSARLSRTSRTGAPRSFAGTCLTPPLKPRHQSSSMDHFPRRCRM